MEFVRHCLLQPSLAVHDVMLTGVSHKPQIGLHGTKISCKYKLEDTIQFH